MNIYKLCAGEPGVIVSDLCHKRNLFPPPCPHPPPLLEDLLDCKVELSLFTFTFTFCSSCSPTGRSSWLQGSCGRSFNFQTVNFVHKILFKFFVLTSQSLLLDSACEFFLPLFSCNQLIPSSYHIALNLATQWCKIMNSKCKIELLTNTF